MALRPHICALCRQDVYRLGEYAYMVHRATWSTVIRRGQSLGLPVHTASLLCVGCFEVCAGRQLSPADLPADIPLNGPLGLTLYGRSPRLTHRMETPTCTPTAPPSTTASSSCGPT